jgi:hypothetical protein
MLCSSWLVGCIVRLVALLSVALKYPVAVCVTLCCYIEVRLNVHLKGQQQRSGKSRRLTEQMYKGEFVASAIDPGRRLEV